MQHPMRLSSLVLTSSLVLLAACTPKPADTESDTGDTGDTGTTATGGAEETSATAPTTTTVDPGTASQSTQDATEGTTGDPDPTTATTATVTTANPTTADPTDDPPGGLPGACQTLCDVLGECGLAPPGQECIDGCISEEEPGTECAMLLADLWTCVAGLNCEQLKQFLETETDFCIAEIKAHDSACGDGGCSMFAGGGPDSCSVGLSCEGLDQEYRCEGDTCTCVENDVPGTTCPNPDLCGGANGEPDFKGLEDAAQACCGWDWS